MQRKTHPASRPFLRILSKQKFLAVPCRKSTYTYWSSSGWHRREPRLCKFARWVFSRLSILLHRSTIPSHFQDSISSLSASGKKRIQQHTRMFNSHCFSRGGLASTQVNPSVNIIRGKKIRDGVAPGHAEIHQSHVPSKGTSNAHEYSQHRIRAIHLKRG